MIDLFALSPAIAFAAFVAVGFVAQLVDGALGMAYGALSSTILMSMGVPPAAASAAIHAAECVTTGASGASHLWHRNIDLSMMARLAPAGVVGGVFGAYVLTGLDQTLLKAVVALYLLGLGLLIVARAASGAVARRGAAPARFAPLGFAGGFLDASGGGGWGPLVASTLIGGGYVPRRVIGTVNASEFFVATAISATFAWSIATGRLDVGQGAALLGSVVAGLIVGGLIAAPFAGYVTRAAPARPLMAAVGLAVTALAAWQAWQAWPLAAQDPALVALARSVASPALAAVQPGG